MNVEDVSQVKPPENIYKPDSSDSVDKTSKDETETIENQDNETQTNDAQNNNDQYTQYNVNLLA